nr:hypothetical protein 75 [Balneolaceae bacterium]
MTDLNADLYACLTAIEHGGCLCDTPLPNGNVGGTFHARGSTRIPPNHPGWPAKLVYWLTGRGMLKRSGEQYLITQRGLQACREYRQRHGDLMARRAAEAHPGTVVLMADFRK